MNSEAEIRKFLGAWLRQCSGAKLPRQVPMTPALARLANQATAQKIWDELFAAWPGEKES